MEIVDKKELYWNDSLMILRGYNGKNAESEEIIKVNKELFWHKKRSLI